MPICEFSGEDTDRLVTVKIEGVTMRVAPKYARYGEKTEDVEVTRVKRETKRRREEARSVKANASDLVRRAFQKLGTDEESLARSIGMKESQLKAYLRGDITITLADAQTFEKFFSISLIEENTDEPVSATNYSAKSDGLTLGDLLKGAKRR